MKKGNTKPFVNLACICENALQDKDGVISAIRVIDTVFVDVPQNLPANTEAVVEYWCVVAIKSGDLVGTFDKLRLRINGPDGAAKELTDKPIPTPLSGGTHGMNVRVNLKLVVKKYGVNWIDVLWGDDLLTSIPLEIKPSAEAPK